MTNGSWRESLRRGWLDTPLKVRVVPFGLFVLPLYLGGLGEAWPYWSYAGRTLLGAGLVWLMWPVVREMRWSWSWPAVGVGVGVFAAWVGLDPYVPRLGDWLERLGLSWLAGGGEAVRWNPHEAFGQGSVLAWGMIVVRCAGSTLVVPPLEEVFYRSFLYRYLARVDFLAVELRDFRAVPFVATALIFGLSHHEWLAGILCGCAYQWLVLRRGHLGDAMTAHAITNGLLGVWVAGRGQWQFW